MRSETPILIKVSHKSDKSLQEKKHWFLQQPGCNWLTKPIPDKNTPILNITRQAVFLQNEGECLSFHPSMALLRLLNIFRGESDRYLEATGLSPGDILLDATLGLGTDALIGAWAVGEKGRVLAVEHSPILSAIVQDGLASLIKGPLPQVKNPNKRKAWHVLSQAARRIQIHWGNHVDFLKHQPDSSVDVVYFDPMFRLTRIQSSSIRPLHYWSNLEALSEEAVYEARRVARKRIVLKERKNSSEFARLGFTIIPGGKYSPVDYGVILI